MAYIVINVNKFDTLLFKFNTFLKALKMSLLLAKYQVIGEF